MTESVSAPEPEISGSVTAPRTAWFDFLLLLLTLGLYTPFLLVSQIRDLKKLYQSQRKPWLWFFVPLFLPAQLFALPSLHRELTGYEQRMGLTLQNWIAVLWIIAVVLLTLLSSVINRSETVAEFWLFPILALLAGLYSLLAWRIHRIKRVDTRLHEQPRQPATHWWEWVVAIMGFLLTIVLAALMVFESMMEDVLARHVDVPAFTVEGTGLTWPIQRVPWLEIETPEDPDDLVTLRGVNRGFIVNVYQYSNQSVNEVLASRHIQAMNIDDGMVCSEHQTFEPGSLNVKAVQECITSIDFGTDAQFSAVLERDGTVYELYALVATPESEDGGIMTSIRAAIEGFSLQ
ncbi:hypothetical protein [Reinekea blandensis]|uniref:Uncharacterized protein n=1 Tax=Reinekea blandensis MED297 TaxID=314283 RepID=A4BAB3_9GAMM|nr:hypothetical protein [Reinekea blandensis]EAR10869.1 hypothetical protein MED297_10176 [Reinekea sp. MED297] [Reinekea blandensis MED297]